MKVELEIYEPVAWRMDRLAAVLTHAMSSYEQHYNENGWLLLRRLYDRKGELFVTWATLDDSAILGPAQALANAWVRIGKEPRENVRHRVDAGEWSEYEGLRQVELVRDLGQARPDLTPPPRGGKPRLVAT